MHRWEVTYTCTTGDEAQPPFRPVVVSVVSSLERDLRTYISHICRYSRLGGSEADTPRPALHIAVESTDVPVKREPEVGAVILGKRARSPSPTVASRSTHSNAASGMSRSPHSPGNDPALRRQTGTNKPRGRPPKRQHDTDRRRSASPRRRSDGTKLAKRAQDMCVYCLVVYRVRPL